MNRVKRVVVYGAALLECHGVRPHSRYCCNGENQKCFGVTNKLKKGDVIPEEEDRSGKCEMRCVCPKEKEAACSGEARMPENYHVGPFGMDCQEWVDGVSSSCAR